MSTTVNVCPERASGDSPFRGASSHVTDCRWLGRRGVRVSTSVHRGPRPEHMVQKAVHRLGSATQRPESSVVLQTDPVGCCPPSKWGEIGWRGSGHTPARDAPWVLLKRLPRTGVRQSLRESSWRASPSVARQPSGVVRRLDTSNRKLASLRIPDLASSPAVRQSGSKLGSSAGSCVLAFRARPDRQLTDGADPCYWPGRKPMRKSR